MLLSLLFVRINNGVNIYQFTSGFGFAQNFGGSTDLVKKDTDRRICIPLFAPPLSYVIGGLRIN